MEKMFLWRYEMNTQEYNAPFSLKKVQITDSFWKEEMELVRTEVIPYQWRALNDQIPDAEPSFCMRNFRLAGELNQRRKEQGAEYKEIVWPTQGWETLPKEKSVLEERFYGYVFQDSDFYKWIEAVGYSLIWHPDPELEKIADTAIDIVCEAQLDNGYLDTYYIINDLSGIFTNLQDKHELYCFGHLTQGAIAYYQATGKDKLLNAAKRYADFISTQFGAEDGKKKGYPGHEIAEMALAELYDLTGEEKYLKLGSFFINQRGQKPYYFDMEHPKQVMAKEIRYRYYQAHLPVRQQKEAVGHAVRAVYLYSGMADMAKRTGDDTLYQACENLWNSIEREKLYITGGIGGTQLGESFSFPFDLPNDTIYAETCASIGLVFFARRMLEIHPDRKYADMIERALYNGILSGIALDGKSFFYVNPLEVFPKACHEDERKFHVRPVRQKWFGCACCPPNLARLLSSIGSYAYTENQDTLWIHLYTGGILEKTVQGKKMEIAITSELPWNGKVSVTVKTKEPVSFTLALRIPGWCSQWERPIKEPVTVKDGYCYIQKNWDGEETISFCFPMIPKLQEADDRVREDIGKVALTRGPVVYCLEEADNGENLHLIYVSDNLEAKEEEIQIGGRKILALKTNGFQKLSCIVEKEEGLYHTYKKPQYETKELTWIPYYAWANRGEGEMQVWVKAD